MTFIYMIIRYLAVPLLESETPHLVRARDKLEVQGTYGSSVVAVKFQRRNSGKCTLQQGQKLMCHWVLGPVLPRKLPQKTSQGLYIYILQPYSSMRRARPHLGRIWGVSMSSLSWYMRSLETLLQLQLRPESWNMGTG